MYQVSTRKLLRWNCRNYLSNAVFYLNLLLDAGTKNLINIQNAQKDCRKSDFWKKAERCCEKVIHNIIAENAQK